MLAEPDDEQLGAGFRRLRGGQGFETVAGSGQDIPAAQTRAGQRLGRLGGWAMDDPLTIEVRHEQDYVIVTAVGEIDISTVSRMRECLFDLAASGRPLVANLDQVSFIDSVGLDMLVGTAKRAAASGGSLYVVSSRPKIRQLFGLTGLDCRIPLASTLDEALEALAAAQATP